jgi:hypothetical protein
LREIDSIDLSKVFAKYELEAKQNLFLLLSAVISEIKIF